MSLVPARYKLKSKKNGQLMPANFANKEDARKARNFLNHVTEDNFGTDEWKITRGKDHRLGVCNDD